MPSKLCLLHVSPRKNGNGAAISAAIAAHLAKRGCDTKILHLEAEHIHPCSACGSCAKIPGRCIHESIQGDMARQVLNTLAAAPAMIIVAPVWFYGPPAHLKALIDRSQVFWEQKSSGCSQSTPVRPAWNVLTAGRGQGARLFEASSLILRCFERQMGFTPQAGLALCGLDREDFSASIEAQDQVKTWSTELKWE